MTFQPVVPFGGYSGWIFLQNTMEQQKATFDQSTTIARETSYFRENIGSVTTAEALVDDRRLLNVALSAFGLDDDINSQFFIEKILSEGTADDDALANRLADTTYARLAETLGLGESQIPATSNEDTVSEIVSRFESRQFEAAVGESNNDLRLALNLHSALSDVIDAVTGDDARWFAILGSEPLREVMQFALGLPKEIAALDLDLQLVSFQDRALASLGTSDVADFMDPEIQDKIIRDFLIRSEAANAANLSSQSIALTLLQA